MNIVVFGLTISSSWGNGHATIWRGLCRALGARGHRVTFFERDVPYYAAHRDATMPAGCTSWLPQPLLFRLALTVTLSSTLMRPFHPP